MTCRGFAQHLRGGASEGPIRCTGRGVQRNGLPQVAIRLGGCVDSLHSLQAGTPCNESEAVATKRALAQRKGRCCNETPFPAMKRPVLQRNGFSATNPPKP